MHKGKLQFDRATKELRKRKYNLEYAVAQMIKSHELGFPDAGYAIGTWYIHGFYFKKSLSKGFRLIKKAAKEGVVIASYDLAICYETGSGTKKDETRAFLSYLKSAICGDIDSIRSVGRCYYHGIGVPRNRKIAKIWLDKSYESDSK